MDVVLKAVGLVALGAMAGGSVIGWLLRYLFTDFTNAIKGIPSKDKMLQIDEALDELDETRIMVQQHVYQIKAQDMRIQDNSEDIVTEHKRVTELDREFRSAHAFLSDRVGGLEVRAGILDRRLNPEGAR